MWGVEKPLTQPKEGDQKRDLKGVDEIVHDLNGRQVQLPREGGQGTSAVVDPSTGKTPSMTPRAMLSAIFSGVTPCRSKSTIGRTRRWEKNPSFMPRSA